MSNEYNLPTYLCDYVKELIDSVHLQEEANSVNKALIFNQNNLLNTDYISKICLKYNADNSIDYFQSSKILSKNLNLICSKLLSTIRAGGVDFNAEFPFIHNFISSESDLALIKTCFQNVILSIKNQEKLQIQIYIALLNIFVIFEHYLRQLVLTLSRSNKTGCLNQFLLRDLIANANLEKVLNPNLINLNKIFFATPLSLNLRNLIWHGFLLASNECSYYYFFFLLIILNKIGHELDAFKMDRLNIKKLEDIQQHHKISFENCYIEFESSLSEYFALINKSLYLNEDQKKLVVYIINEIFLREKCFIQVIIATLPIIEFLLRKAYIIENKLDFKFNLSAQEKFFYLTMDEILQEFVPFSNNDGKTLIKKSADNTQMELISVNELNRLRFKIGDDFMILLFDLFMYTDGPRLRDRFSHGEYNLSYDIKDQDKYGFYAILCIYSIFHLARSSKSATELNFDKFFKDYRCMYHPLAAMKHELVDLVNNFSLKQLHDELKLRENLLRLSKSKLEDLKNLNDLIINLNEESTNNKYLFLYSNSKSSNSLQVINIARQLIRECSLFLETIYSYNEITKLKCDSKQLRTRQRETFKYFQENCLLNFESSSYKLVFFLASIFLTLINNSNNIDYLKLLKRILAIFQNLTQQSQINRWLECNQLIKELFTLFSD